MTVSRHIALIVALALFAAPAYAADVPEAPDACVTAVQAQDRASAAGGSVFARATDAQWRFFQGLFVMSPNTPLRLPPGDHAMISVAKNGAMFVMFVDGEQFCDLEILTPDAASIVMDVGAGFVQHVVGERL